MSAFAKKYLILVGYSHEKTILSLRFCNRFFSKVTPNKRLLVVNDPQFLNDSEVGKLAESWQVIEGSNQRHEFSGWQEGLEVVRALKEKDEGVIFINDTVPAHRYFSLFKRVAFYLSLKKPGSVAVGFMQALKDWEPYRLGQIQATGWICSYLFYCSAEALEEMSYQVCITHEVDELIHGGVNESRFFSEKLSSNISQKLQTWLFEGEWYASDRLSIENMEGFKMKARSILNEMLLTGYYQNRDIRIIDPFKQYPLLELADKWFIRFKTSPQKLIRFFCKRCCAD